MCQVLGTVYIWADTICECEYKLCTYMNANLCFISMQTCDDFTALHLQRELFSHTKSGKCWDDVQFPFSNAAFNRRKFMS